jgi:uncharacterized membrane protein
MNRWLPSSTAGRTLAGILLGYVLLFFWLACRKFEYSTGEMGDVAAVNHVFWSSLHGKFFWHFGIDRSYFAMHQEILLFFFWPLYALLPDPRTLFFVQTVCIAASAVPMFFIARRVLKDEWSAVACAVALIMFPSIVSQNVNQLHTSQWVLPLLLACFYFYHVENYRWFLVFAVLAALGKENTPLTLLMFVPYAIWHRRPKKWWLSTLGISVASLILSFKIIGPYFQRGWEYEALGYLSNLGKTWPEVFASLLSPKLFDALFQPANGPYLLQLLQPALWVLPFFAPEVLFALPDLGVNLVAGNTGMKVPVWHYNVYTGGFLVLAGVFAIPRVERWLARRVTGVRLLPVVPVLLAVFAVSHWPFWFSSRHYQPTPWYDAQKRARDLIPPDAPVLVGPQLMVGHFSNRLKFTTHDRLNDDPVKMFEYDWAYFDGNYPGYYPPLKRETVLAFANNPDYELVFNEKNVFVFRRRGYGSR